jgi:hypothetical protein
MNRVAAQVIVYWAELKLENLTCFVNQISCVDQCLDVAAELTLWSAHLSRSRALQNFAGRTVGGNDWSLWGWLL